MKSAVVRFFGHGDGVAWYLIGAMLIVTALSTALFVNTMVAVRFQRDVTRMVFEDDLDLLERIDAYQDVADSALQRSWRRRRRSHGPTPTSWSASRTTACGTGGPERCCSPRRWRRAAARPS
jgi:hypothetical protein